MEFSTSRTVSVPAEGLEILVFTAEPSAAALAVVKVGEEMAEEEAPGTIVDVAVASGSFPTLVAAVQAAGLVDTLNGEGPFTVFAPTEEAFAAALAALGVSAEDLLANTELLTSVLTYHVLPVVAPADVVVTLDGESVTTVNGAGVNISIDGSTVMVNDATVVTTDKEASNGVIHVIDAVLLPPADDMAEEDMGDEYGARRCGRDPASAARPAPAPTAWPSRWPPPWRPWPRSAGQPWWPGATADGEPTRRARSSQRTPGPQRKDGGLRHWRFMVAAAVALPRPAERVVCILAGSCGWVCSERMQRELGIGRRGAVSSMKGQNR
ncbi:MAG: fasciclin domain-containing protein [Acidimicrobiaceae bacterium]|nr:fasciclin domain-containing protein [Acidimicrobiaceae bacterium]MXZ99848.1 fasciclin domain-containing protein [Acidimicrobiaceae bacterium]MYE77074.1 fasciclin domain-containing protein [Acidimicrobiaceae bacterium]MYE98099.1 fasciclin domain-containing protein [Acidimicrobiaceae bacterium]MYH42270.1 fasciclin domain-containing protein [Acidimicrobiaceae bacterium]